MRFIGIDPSTKTGLVVLDREGNVLKATEITAKGSDPKRMIDLIDHVLIHLLPEDAITIEGFSYGSKGNAIDFQYGLGHGLRNAMYRQGFKYTVVSPSAVKKFATGKGNTKKDAMAVPIYKKWGFEHGSDNVRDAYVMARIARELYIVQSSDDLQIETWNLLNYEADVIKAILGG